MDMFSSTDSAKSALDMSPSTDRSTDINAILSCHVECVVLMCASSEAGKC